jgi:hypothetical protein
VVSNSPLSTSAHSCVITFMTSAIDDDEDVRIAHYAAGRPRWSLPSMVSVAQTTRRHRCRARDRSCVRRVTIQFDMLHCSCAILIEITRRDGCDAEMADVECGIDERGRWRSDRSEWNCVHSGADADAYEQRRQPHANLGARSHVVMRWMVHSGWCGIVPWCTAGNGIENAELHQQTIGCATREKPGTRTDQIRHKCIQQVIPH